MVVRFRGEIEFKIELLKNDQCHNTLIKLTIDFSLNSSCRIEQYFLDKFSLSQLLISYS